MMAIVSEPVVTEPITVDAACQTTSPSIEEEVKEVESALDLCVEKDDFEADSDSTIEGGEEDTLTIDNTFSVVKEILTE